MFPENLLTTSGLSIFMHGVISLSDATSYDKGQLNVIDQLCSGHIKPELLWFIQAIGALLSGVNLN